MTTETYFKDLCNIDTRQEIYEERIRIMEENMLPFGFIRTGAEVERFVYSEGDIWTVE